MPQHEIRIVKHLQVRYIFQTGPLGLDQTEGKMFGLVDHGPADHDSVAIATNLA